MIKVTDIVLLLRAKLGNVYSVDASASLLATQDRSRLKLPAFYVALGAYSAGVISTSEYRQSYDERLIITYECDNTKDRTGKYGQDSVPTARRALWSVLLNRQLTQGDGHPMVYVGDNMVEMDLARYFHQFQFQILGEIGADDTTPDDYLDLESLYTDYNLTESDDLDLPNAQDILNLTT